MKISFTNEGKIKTFSKKKKECVAIRPMLHSGRRKLIPGGNLDPHKGMQNTGNGKYEETVLLLHSLKTYYDSLKQIL